MHFSSPPFTPHGQLSSSCLIASTECYPVKSTDQKAPHYVVFLTPLLLHPSHAQYHFYVSWGVSFTAYKLPNILHFVLYVASVQSPEFNKSVSTPKVTLHLMTSITKTVNNTYENTREEAVTAYFSMSSCHPGIF